MPALHHQTLLIKQKALELGFSFAGVSKAGFLEHEAKKMEDWLQKGFHGKMTYMENHFDKRLDPTKLVPGAKSVLSLGYNYFTEKRQNPGAPKISTYAYGTDYHVVVKEKLKQLLAYIQDEIGDVQGRCFVDSAPILERAWAAKSGLGWVGKNGNLIHKGMGSFFFLAQLITDLELEADGPVKDYCGTCTACMDACPTQAIVAPAQVDGSRCISFLTIELREQIPDSFKGQMDNWAFGCDVCQDVCPWNRFSKPHNEPDFEANETVLGMTAKQWEEITEEVFIKFFKNSPLQRAGYNGLRKNIDFLKKSVE